MRRLSIALALALIATLVACAAPAAPGWTYAPAPSVTPAASVEASGSPAASEVASAAPTPKATAKATETPEPGGSAGASGGTGLTITAPVGASTTGFDTNRLEAEAGIPFTITFDNQDTGVIHNFVLKKPDGTNVDIGDTAFFAGVAEKTYNVSALDAGEYPFLCEVHPLVMKGVMTIG